MTMFPLKEELTCFMKHFRLLATEDGMKTNANPLNTTMDKRGETQLQQQQQLIHSRIQTELLEGVSRFEQILKNIEEPEVEEEKMKRDEDELLRTHYKLGLMSFAKIRFMAIMGWVEPKLAKCQIPKCAGCLFGKAMCKPWRTKGTPNSILKSSKPGEVVLIDQLTVTGVLTHKRYNYATVLLDHFSNLPYIVFQRALTEEETVVAKASFEGYVVKHGVRIRH